MARKQSDDSFSEREAARRLDALFQGAFSGPPTPLKGIPTKLGKQRRSRKQANLAASKAISKTGQSRKSNPA